METKTIATEIADSRLSPPFDELNEKQIQAILYVQNRKTVDTIKDKLSVSERTVYHILDGLLGKKQGVPPKWHCEEKYLEKIHRRYSASIHYKLSDLSYQLVSDDIPHKNCNSDEIELPDDSKSDMGEGVRPHYLLSKHQIRGSPEGWGEEMKVDEKRQIYQEVDYKEMPDGSAEEFITTYYDGYEVQLYRNTVVVRVDFPEANMRPEILWRKYRARVREILGFVEDKFGLQLVSRPEHIEACMRGQHWAEVDSMFANWLWENRDEVGDDREGLQFHVYDENEDLMALVDASHGEPEFEWQHTQEAKHHMSNMKDLIMWGGYYEITPKDFKSLAWLRKNKDVFESVLDSLDVVDELEAKLEEFGEELDLTKSQVQGLTMSIREVRGRLDSVEDRLDDVEFSVKSNESVIDGLSEQVQRNRDEFYGELNDQAEKIDETRNMAQDVVERVDYTRQEVQENKERVEEVRSEVSERVREDYEVIQEQVDDVRQDLNGVVQQNRGLQSNQEDIMKELQLQRQQLQQQSQTNAEKLDALIEEQRKTFVDRVKENLKQVSGAVTAAASMIIG